MLNGGSEEAQEFHRLDNCRSYWDASQYLFPKIELMPDLKQSIEHQKRLNRLMQDVVKNDIIKWLDTGVIYPIEDYNWVCLV